jgi:hypothetical protein
VTLDSAQPLDGGNRSLVLLVVGIMGSIMA